MKHISVRLDRRSVLLGGLSLAGSLGLAPRLRGMSRGHGDDADDADAPRNLVLVQFSGGNDGLSMVVPHGDDVYHQSRKSTRFKQKDVLALDDYRGLHPELQNIRRLYDAGQFAIVEGTGYPEPNRSHFKSLEIWHTGRATGRISGDGWIGRMCAEAWSEEVIPELVVHVGSGLPYSLHSNTHPPVAFARPNGYRWVGDDEEQARYRANAQEKPVEPAGVLGDLRRVLRDAQDSSARVRRAAADYRPRNEFPNDSLGQSLLTVAALIEARIGTRVFSVELGGFDTHTNQMRRHTTLMRRFDHALNAFLADLSQSEAGRNTLVVVFSEFGRRVKENGSKGTDHGVAGPMFVAGAGVRGGLYGEHPSLEGLDSGDLVHTTDFRSVYATALESWFGFPHQRVLGERYPLLPFLSSPGLPPQKPASPPKSIRSKG